MTDWDSKWQTNSLKRNLENHLSQLELLAEEVKKYPCFYSKQINLGKSGSTGTRGLINVEKTSFRRRDV